MRRLLQEWVVAHAEGDADTYLAHYHEGISPRSGMTRESWVADRRDRLAAAEGVVITLQLESMGIDEDGNVDVIFIENYRSASYSDAVRKQLFLAWSSPTLKIRREVVLD